MAWSTQIRARLNLPRSCSGRSVRLYIDVNQLGSRSRILTLSMLTLCSGLSVLTWKRDSRVLSVSPMYLSMHFSLRSPPQANLSLLLYAILSVQQRKAREQIGSQQAVLWSIPLKNWIDQFYAITFVSISCPLLIWTYATRRPDIFVHTYHETNKSIVSWLLATRW